MKLIFTLFLFCGMVYSKGQIYTSSCVPTPQMMQLYKNDAYKYAVLRLVKTNSNYKDSIEIPPIYRDSIAKVFYAIHNMAPSLVKDTIMNLFGFTNFTSYQYEADSLHYQVASPATYNNSQNVSNLSGKSVQMYVSNTIPWASQWAAGNYNNTSEPRVNQLVNQYQLSVATGVSLPNTYYFKVTASSAINVLGLAKQFNDILTSTTTCTPYIYIGDGNAIELTYEPDGIKVTYSNRCGDCPAGCTYGRQWMFKVFYTSCSVQYLGSISNEPGFPPNAPSTCTRGPVLPLTFGTLTGYLQSGKPALTWKVLTQVNVKEYIVERSDDGSQFYAVDKMPATTTTAAEYTWKDVQVLSGTAWFRIKAVDIDGKQKYSSIVKLSNTKSGGINIYPNPVQNHQFTIQFATPISGQVQTRLYDISGKQVWSNAFNLTPQTASRTFELPASLPAGTYSIVLQSEAVSYRQTLMIGSK